MAEAPRHFTPRHVVVITKRAWPPSGETPAQSRLTSSVARWTAEGHRVTVLTPRATDHGTAPENDASAGLAVHRAGSRLTLAFRARRALRKARPGATADVVIEEVSGFPLGTPLWAGKPSVALVPAPAGELERSATGARVQSVALSLFYRTTTLVAPSVAAQSELHSGGLALERIQVADPVTDPDGLMTILGEEASQEPERMFAMVKRAGRSDTAKAAGLAVAALSANVFALLFTLVFTRILGADRYGSLGTLINYFFFLSVFGQAMQVAAAREATLGGLGTGRAMSATVTRWGRDLAFVCIGLGVLGGLLRHQLSDLTGVKESWAAASVLITGGLWLLMSIERGVLLGLREFRIVGLSIIGEAVGRLLTGLLLVVPGLGVTGAFLGTPLSMLITAGVLFLLLRRKLGRPHADGRPHSLLLLFRTNWASMVALAMIALLQVLDQLIIKHRIGGDKAGAYIAATVAAKAVIWVAIGVGLHLLPEATRLAAEGRDPRPALRKALGLIVVIASPALLIFLAVPKLLLRVAFGHPEFVQASGALVILGAAFAVLAVTYLGVQYLLALGRIVFLPILVAVVAAEGIALLRAHTLVGYAWTVLVWQCVAAAAVLFLSLRRVPAQVPAGVPGAP
jgi:O-antigen/teichoic acid export membrane protein